MALLDSGIECDHIEDLLLSFINRVKNNPSEQKQKVAHLTKSVHTYAFLPGMFTYELRLLHQGKM